MQEILIITIDDMLTAVSKRSMFSQTEVADWLLDLRAIAVAGDEVVEVKVPEPVPA